MGGSFVVKHLRRFCGALLGAVLAIAIGAALSSAGTSAAERADDQADRERRLNEDPAVKQKAAEINRAPEPKARQHPPFPQIPEVERQAEDKRRAGERRKARRQTPESKAERRRSRSAHKARNRAQASQLARDQFSDLFSPDDRRALPLSENQQLVRFTGPNSALVKTEGEGSSVVESTTPLQTTDPSGDLKPVDLDLQRTATGWEPKSAGRPLALGERADRALSLPDAFSVGVAESQAGGERTANEVFFGDVAPDTDAWFGPTPTGARVAFQLRSADSPEQLRLRFDLAPGAKLRQAENKVELVRDGKTVGGMGAPTAFDADDEPIPARLRLDGSEVVIEVDHRDRDALYPLAVDPAYEGQDSWKYGAANRAGWTYYENRPIFPHCFVPTSQCTWGPDGSGFYISRTQHAAPLYSSDFAEYQYSAPNANSYITRADFLYARHNASSTQTTQGMWSRNRGRFIHNLTTPGHLYYENRIVCVEANISATPCDDNVADLYGANNNYVQSSISPNASAQDGRYSSQPAHMYFGGARVWMSDANNPLINYFESLPSGWVHDVPARGFSAANQQIVRFDDPGLGMKSVALDVPGKARQATTHGCSGGHSARCPGYLVGAFSLEGISEGAQTIRATGTDATQRTSPAATGTVKTDRSAPSSPDTSGALWADREQTIFSSHRDLEIDASDAYSGVKSIEVKVDNQRKFYEERTCPSTGCEGPMNDRSFRFIADDYEDGDHKVKVIVRDQLADQLPPGPTQDRHIATKEWDVTVDHRAGDFRPARFLNEPLNDRMRARTNANNGNLLVEANDMNIAGLGMNLSISRYYNSRLAQTEGRLGYGWKLSVGRDFRIDEIDGSEDVRLYGANGFFTRFKHQADQSGNEEFREPPGIDGELDTRPGGGYNLRLDGNAERLVFSPNGSLDTRVDRNGNEIKYTYEGLELRKITDAKGREVDLTYSAGLLRDIHDTAGDRHWRFGYDEATRDLKTYTDPEDKVTSYSYDAKHRLDTITDPNGKVTDFGYDISPNLDLRRIASVQRARGDAAAQRTTSFAYANGDSRCPDQEGNRAQDLTDVTDALGHTTRYCRDNTDGRVRRIIDARQNKRSLDYDAASANVTSFENGSGAQSKSEYEGRDLKSTTSAAGAATTFDRQGGTGEFSHFLKGSTDAAGNTLGRSYTSNGNLKGTSAKGGAQQEAVTLVSLDYNDQTAAGDAACDQPGHGDDSGPPGTVRCSEDGNGNETRYRYSDAGNQKGNLLEKDPQGPHGKVNYTYDSLSRMKTTTDAEGNKASYGYDRLDRVVSVAWTREGQSPTTTTYSYDPNGNRTQRTDAQGTSTYAFSARNQLLSETLPAGANHAYSYDSVGNLASLTDAGGQVLYDYNEVNLVDSIVEPPATEGEPASARTTSFDYNAHNGRYRTSYPNGVVQSVDFEESQAAREADPPRNDADDTTKIEGIKATRGSEILSNLSWSYQVGGSGGTDTEQRRVMEDHRRNERTTYEYDHLNRLTLADTNHCTGQTCDEDRERFVYEFDRNSNRLESTDSVGAPKTSYAYNETNALCWSYVGDSSADCNSPPSGATDYDYDLNGALTASSDGRDLDYNLKDQTTSAKAPGQSPQAMGYLGDTQQERNSRGEASFADSLLGLSSATKPGRAVRYTRGPGGELISQRTPEGRQYYLTDSIGSVVGLTHQSGTIANRYRYDPFGNTMHQGTEENVSNPFRFGGEFYDSEIKLYKQGLRFYDPKLGRWTQRDPLDQVTEPRQSNRYAFAGQDGVNMVDPSGAIGVGNELGQLFNELEEAARGPGARGLLGTSFLILTPITLQVDASQEYYEADPVGYCINQGATPGGILDPTGSC